MQSALASSQAALEQSQASEETELSDIGALFIENQRITKELEKLEASTHASVTKRIVHKLHHLVPGVVSLLSMTSGANFSVVWRIEQAVESTCTRNEDVQVEVASREGTFVEKGQ